LVFSGEVPLTSGAGDGVDQHQQQSCTSAILVQEEEVMDKFQLPPLKTFYAGQCDCMHHVKCKD